MTDRDDHTRQPETTSRRPRRRRPAPARALTLVLATTAVMALAAVGAMAGSSMFGDVRPGDTHEQGIGWLANTGVTAGCEGGLYCPDDAVNRAQMATFMYRLAGQADGVDPSVDAASLEGLDLAEVIAAAQPELPPQYWAVVEADATSTELARGSGADSASGGIGTEGRFTVTFDEDVSACSYQATADVAPTKDNANVAEVRSGPTDQSVDVWVTNTEFGWVNTGFHLLVTC